MTRYEVRAAREVAPGEVESYPGAPEDKRGAAGYFFTLYRSTDDGKTWEALNDFTELCAAREVEANLSEVESLIGTARRTLEELRKEATR